MTNLIIGIGIYYLLCLFIELFMQLRYGPAPLVEKQEIRVYPGYCGKETWRPPYGLTGGEVR